jgi:hypothetical protein
LNNPILIALALLHLLALADIWSSRLTLTARVLWSLILVFLPGAGLFAWLLTRGSAHRPTDEAPPVDEEDNRVANPS